MFVGRAAAVPDLPVVAAPGVELAGFGQRPHLVVDRREGDVLALGLELGVEVLGPIESRRMRPGWPPGPASAGSSVRGPDGGVSRQNG